MTEQALAQVLGDFLGSAAGIAHLAAAREAGKAIVLSVGVTETEFLRAVTKARVERAPLNLPITVELAPTTILLAPGAAPEVLDAIAAEKVVSLALCGGKGAYTIRDVTVIREGARVA